MTRSKFVVITKSILLWFSDPLHVGVKNKNKEIRKRESEAFMTAGNLVQSSNVTVHFTIL